MSVIALALVKEALGIEKTVDDAELQARLDEAEAEYAEWVAPLTGGGTLRADGTVVVLPRHATVTAVAYTDGPALDLSLLDVDPASGLLRLPLALFRRGSRNLLVTWTAGPMPLNHRAAVIADVAGLWTATQRGGGSGAPRFPGEGYAEPLATAPGRPMVLFPRIRALASPAVA